MTWFTVTTLLWSRQDCCWCHVPKAIYHQLYVHPMALNTQEMDCLGLLASSCAIESNPAYGGAAIIGVNLLGLLE